MCRKLKLPEDFDYQQLARLTPGYVGADLMALCREAAMSAVNRVLLEIRGRSRGQSSATELSTDPVQTEAAAVMDEDEEVKEQQPTDDTEAVPQEQNQLQVWGEPTQSLQQSPLSHFRMCFLKRR